MTPSPRTCVHSALLLATCVASACAPDPPEVAEWQPLFNGQDLTGWTPKIRGHALGDDPYGTFRVADGVIQVGYEGYVGLEYSPLDPDPIPVAKILPTSLASSSHFAPVYVDRGETQSVYVFRGDVEDKYVKVPIEGSVLESLTAMMGQAPPIPHLALRYSDDKAAHINALGFGMLPGLTLDDEVTDV